MKKLLCFIGCMVMMLFVSMVCKAGDIPEALLGDDNAQVYFGEVTSLVGDSVTVIQRTNIKGDFVQNRTLTYTAHVFTDSPEIGTVYLCGYLDEHNPLYIWATSNTDTRTLTLKNTDDMSKRMENYLHSGEFEEREKNRQARITSQNDIKPVETILTTAIMGKPVAGFTGIGRTIILGACGALVIATVLYVLSKRG